MAKTKIDIMFNGKITGTISRQIKYGFDGKPHVKYHNRDYIAHYYELPLEESEHTCRFYIKMFEKLQEELDAKTEKESTKI